MNKGEENSKITQNFGLTAEDFETLTMEMRNGNDTLFEQTFLYHFESAMKYLMSKLNANRDNAYDITMNVMIEFRERILADKISYGNLKFMFTQMCTQRYRRQMGKTLDTEDYAYRSQHDDQVYDEETFEMLDKAIDKMGENCQKLIKDVYYDKLSYKSLEDKYQSTAASLRKQKERCITKLKMLLRQTLNH